MKQREFLKIDITIEGKMPHFEVTILCKFLNTLCDCVRNVPQLYERLCGLVRHSTDDLSPFVIPIEHEENIEVYRQLQDCCHGLQDFATPLKVF